MTQESTSNGKSDWAALEAMTPEERHAAALSDPDAQPIRPEDLPKMPLVPRTITMRRRMKLTQEQFSEQFQIPLQTILDWEERRSEPDPAARAYLRVIAFETEAVRRALASPPFLAAAAE